MMEEITLQETRSDNRSQTILFMMSIILVAFNLRPAITSVGPVIGLIRDDLQLENWNVAFIMSLPLIAFAILSPLTASIAKKISTELTLVIGLALLVFGMTIRTFPMNFLLFFGTLCVGLGIAVCNVLLPSIIKDRFPLKVGLMTGLYTTCMGLMATTASALSLPLADGAGFGWQWSMYIWVIPAVLAFFIWLYIWRKAQSRKSQDLQVTMKEEGSIFKSKLAWAVACFMGLQSMIFYVTISWLPEILMDRGIPAYEAGYMLSYFQLVGLPVSFIVPVIASRLKTQRIIVYVVNSGFLLGIILLMNVESLGMLTLAVTLLGFSSSSNFSLALAFLSFRAKDRFDAARLSGMAQSIGYGLAAIGPVMLGYMYDLTLSWTMPLYTLMIVTLFIMVFGTFAGQNKHVFD